MVSLFLKPQEIVSTSSHHCLFCPRVLEAKKAKLQTQNQTVDSYTEHGSQVLLDQYFQIPLQDSIRRDTLWIRSLHKQMPDKLASGMRCRRLRVSGSWNNFLSGLPRKRQVSPLEAWSFFNSHKSQTEDAERGFHLFRLHLSLLKQLFPVCSGKKDADQILQTGQLIPAVR